MQFGTQIKDESTLLNALNSGTASIAESATINADPSDNNDDSYLGTDKNAKGIKFASSKHGASLTFTPVDSNTIKSLTVKAVAWKAESAFTVNNQDATFSKVSEGVSEKTLAAAQEFTFDFETPAESITISSLEDNTFVIVGITLTM